MAARQWLEWWNAQNSLDVPMVALYITYIANVMCNGSMVSLHSNFIHTAGRKVTMRRIIYAALKPVHYPYSPIGAAFVGIITSSMVIETIYSLPGITDVVR